MPDFSELQFTTPAMRILENEHRYLSFLMEEWHAIVLWFEQETISVDEGRTRVQELRKGVLDFTGPLKKHTAKEETHFFRCLALISVLNRGRLSVFRRSTAKLTITSAISCITRVAG